MSSAPPHSAALALALVPGAGTAQEVSFSLEVRPILAERCTLCHGPDAGRRGSGLRLDVAEGLAAVVVPGDPGASELHRRIARTDDERMPPPDHAEALSEAEVDVLHRWIAGGGAWEEHWAYAPLRAVEPPDVRDAGWVRDPIDRFVLARLEREGIAPSPEADARTLLRRATLDLTGLIPTREEIDAFLADVGPGVYERAVDRLLASPHYAERWARHWLDLARYADSHGFTIDGPRSIWPYRDWVVEAIHSGMPFDRFTVEQLAGDLLPAPAPGPTTAQLVATGFHRNTQINEEGGAKDEENRVNAVFDRVETTGAVWLGSTLGCARCHDHKYDPLAQEEYYRLFAFFDRTEDGGVRGGPTVSVPDGETRAAVEAFEAELEHLEAELRAAEEAAAAGWERFVPDAARAENGPELVALADGSLQSVGQNPETSVYTLEGPGPATSFVALRLEALPDAGLPGDGPGRADDGSFVLSRVRLFARVSGAEDGDWRELALERAGPDVTQEITGSGGAPHVAVFRLARPAPAGARLSIELHQGHGARHVLGRFRVRLGDARAAARAVEVPERWRAAWRSLREHLETRPRVPTSLVMRERAEGRTTRVLIRGNFLDPGAPVAPGFPAALNHFAPGAEPRDRLDLARWLVDPRNALVQRVTVNRWWQRFFGLGLVETENDFGLRGARPTHPDLLEWLARELVEGGFSMKALHRRIVTSATYRQSSRPRPELARLDPRNRLLARQARLRIDAECIRDAALVASGLLCRRIGGPPVQPPQPDGVFQFTQSQRTWEPSEGPDRYRRALYTRLWRSATFPFYMTFDAPVPNVTCTRRTRSTTPLQALALANDPMMVELAQGLARRVLEIDVEDAVRLEVAFELCLSRLPSRAESDVLERHLRESRERGAGTGDAELRAWTAVARVLLNLDELVTRE